MSQHKAKISSLVYTESCEQAESGLTLEMTPSLLPSQAESGLTLEMTPSLLPSQAESGNCPAGPKIVQRGRKGSFVGRGGGVRFKGGPRGGGGGAV